MVLRTPQRDNDNVQVHVRSTQGEAYHSTAEPAQPGGAMRRSNDCLLILPEMSDPGAAWTRSIRETQEAQSSWRKELKRTEVMLRAEAEVLYLRPWASYRRPRRNTFPTNRSLPSYYYRKTPFSQRPPLWSYFISHDVTGAYSHMDSHPYRPRPAREGEGFWIWRVVNCAASLGRITISERNWLGLKKLCAVAVE
jgi:hypothetical protein